MLQKLNKELLKLLTGPKRTYPNEYPIFDLQPQQISGFLEAVWELWLKVSQLPEDQVGHLRETSPTAVLPSLGRVSIGTDECDDLRESITRAALAKGFGSDPRVDGTIKRMLSSSSDCVTDDEVRQAAENVLRSMLIDDEPNSDPKLADPLRHWDHLMYAYLIENTRAVEIVKKLMVELLSDEVHGQLSDTTFRWLRTTEDLFFRDGNSSLISSVTSWVRPDLGATRRNAYQRMFGIDLNHGAADGQAYVYPKATIANADFVPLLQDLLRELWRGYVNAKNVSGTNTTDDSNIRELILRLRNMLNARRLSAAGRANLAREEFVFVAMMSWFELTVGDKSPVVTDLKAGDSTPEERLRKIGERVKLPMHSKSRNFFTLANNLPRLLTLIEQGHFESDETTRLLYTPVAGRENPLLAAVLQIINHWSLATGVDLKAMPTTQGPR